MAREFIIIDRPTARIRVLALFPIPASIKVAGVIPTPAVGLPDEISNDVDASEKSALNTGDLVFRVLTFRPFEIEPPTYWANPDDQDPNELADQSLPQKVYAGAEAEVLREYSRSYSPVGRGNRADGR